MISKSISISDKEENSSLLNIESCLALGLIQNSSSKIFQTSKDNLIRDKIWDILDSTSTDHRERNGHLEKGSHSLASTVRPFFYLDQEYQNEHPKVPSKVPPKVPRKEPLELMPLAKTSKKQWVKVWRPNEAGINDCVDAQKLTSLEPN